ncbi:MAG TPA: N-6 DNA methylase [Thermoleophilia bacterium]|nr:N-6 DNA methylase [Anaerolineae bacterium]HQG04103.1 N-6 DNA methylase [Thermoleophilia bacterium]HQJ98249.1 N-6 DNA methylase [Thermoleophilia bacterium]
MATSSASARSDSPLARKARGAFFTPAGLCDYVVTWAVRDPNDLVLEPSCGEAAFLAAAGRRLRALDGGQQRSRSQLIGYELHEDSAELARARLASVGVEADVEVADFFGVEPVACYDAVVGNPPYIRYQDFSGEARTRSRAAALRAGVSLSGLASSWAAFTVHAALFLKPEGRLGLVLPAELLSVNYAAGVRRYLMERFSRVRLVLFDKRVFPGVQEEVVLLLAEGTGPTDCCELRQVANLAELDAREDRSRRWRPVRPEGKWTPSLMSAEAQQAYTDVTCGSGFATLQDWGETTLGMVTGNNRYFALSPSRADELGLDVADVIAVSPPGSRHLRALALTEVAWRELGKMGKSTLLFRPSSSPSPAAQAYIRAGEETNVHEAYKCRVRSPWWRVPLVPPPDLFLTYMNADAPRLCSNRIRAHHLNSVHGLYLRPGLRRIGIDLLPLGALNSLTLLGAEAVGRSYGGGMLKLEPREADRLPVPSPASLISAWKSLSAIRPCVAQALRGGSLRDAVRLVDDCLLVEHLDLARSQVKVLREAYEEMSARRRARGTEPHVPG